MNTYKKPIEKNISETCIYPKMHINPHFNQQMNTLRTPHINPIFYSKMFNSKSSEPIAANGQKIYINPKFVNVSKLYSNSTVSSVATSGTSVTTPRSHHQSIATSVAASARLMNRQSKSKYKLVNVKLNPVQVKQGEPSTFSVHSTPCVHPARKLATPSVSTAFSVGQSSKSRYSLVRKSKSQSTPRIATVKKTIQISRYKTVLLQKMVPKTEVVRNVNTTKPSVSSVSQWTNVKHRKIDRRNIVFSKWKALSVPINRFNNTLNGSFTNSIIIKGRKFSISDKSLRLVGSKNNAHLDCSSKLTVRVNGRTYIQKSQDLFVRKSIVTKASLKKNNIPCPMFRKFGKCIRKERGDCPLLHDKRHVIICRKFLKGQCQDDNCLLSHQVSAKKMPTCSFYLQGCCTRENCPYLHVKVSDSALVCTDFLKGYCERGEQCVMRHVYLCSEYAKNGNCTRSKCPYPHKKVEYKITNATEPSKVKPVIKALRNVKATKASENAEDKMDAKRYYMRDNSEKVTPLSGANEIITSRSRLGTLPSFIKL